MTIAATTSGVTPAAASGARGRTTLIESDASAFRLDWREMWRYRELLYILVWRDVKVRYKQTLMGVAWVVVQPLLTTLLFAFIFARLRGAPAGGLPYPLFAFSGLLLWTFFANGVTSAMQSLINNSNLVTKVYFPRLFIPAAAVLAGLLDLAIAGVVLCGIIIYYGVAPTPRLLLAPLFVGLMLALALAAGLIVSAVAVKFRDLRHAVPFLLQILMLASPVIYSSEIVGGWWRTLFLLNPVGGIVEGFRAALFGGKFDSVSIAAAIVSSVALLVVALGVFRRLEDTFADTI